MLKSKSASYIFLKIALAGGRGQPEIFWWVFIFSLKSSALDHSATAPVQASSTFNILDFPSQ